MDPISVSGLALGVVSLTFQIFSGCITAYQLLLDANGMPERYQFLWVRLQMEQNKLLGWARIANLSEKESTLSPGLRMSRHTINDVLHQIESLLLDLGGLSQKYRLKLVVDDKPSTGRNNEPPQLPPPPTGQDAIKRTALGLMAKSRRYPSRLRWAALDQQKFEHLLTDLTTLNDSMMYLLEGEQKRLLYELQQNSFMQILQLSNKMDELYSLVSSLEAAGQAARSHAGASRLLHGGRPALPSTESPSARLRLEDRLMRLAKFKAASVAVEQNIADPFASMNPDSPVADSSPELSEEKLIGWDDGVPGASDTRAWSTYDGASVWVEWKHYLPVGLEPVTPPYVADRVRKLAKLLRSDHKPVEFRVPDCLGYVHLPELERYGYVFRWPTTEPPVDLSREAPPVSLDTLLRSTECPSLSVRVAMMRVIATSIWYLHATNWLHKGLRSENIVFPSLKSAPVLTSPFLGGFEYSRPAEAGEQTEKPAESLEQDLYRHPKAQFDLPREGARGFRKIYDIFSLGVVLLEIALWEPVRTVLGIPEDRAVSPKDAKGAWNVLAKERPYLGRLRAMVGDSVGDAAVACLAGDFGLKDGAMEEQNNAILQAAFGECVVKMLDGISV